MDLLSMQSHGLKHALSALVSVIASTPQGIEYLTQMAPNKTDLSLIERIVELVQQSEDGSVTQRFQIACLQKLSAQNSSQLDETVTERIIELMTQSGMIGWCLRLLERAKQPKRERPNTPSIHSFCLDFASALLANLLHAQTTIEMLHDDQNMTKDYMGALLNLIDENDQTKAFLPTSTIIHLLICLSYLSKERFQEAKEATQFVDSIQNFVERFSQRQVGETDQESSDKKLVLDLCAHMFHAKDTTNANDVSATMEYNELKQEEKIKEFKSA